ncbi:MAG: hypothetical protein H6713_09725 [Myxococcales bacterium]|nr:hypothetical protein [Myxococcales bacterium]
MTDRISLLRRRLLLFTGKGGVGKSTVVAAIAEAAARRGQRPLIVELGHRASMQDIFLGRAGGSGRRRAPKIGHEPVAVRPDGGVWAMNIDLESALFDYVVEQVKVKRIARMITGNRTLDRLFRAAPAVREIVMLNKLRQLERQQQADGAPRWSPILVDLDATGHALMFLEMPRMLRKVIAHGPLRGLVDSLTELFTDRQRTTLCLVTLPLEVPVQETLELYHELTELHEVSIGGMFINQVPAAPLDDAAIAALDELETRARASDDVAAQREVLADVTLARRMVASYRHARAQVERLRELGLPTAELPRMYLRSGEALDLEALGERALTGLEGGDA